jgi:predicted AlkP superfamily pyrophosphatase or phosphodiesterase
MTVGSVDTRYEILEVLRMSPDKKKVLIIGIDGCRPDTLIAAETPNLDALIDDGLVSYQAQTCEFTMSAPGWSSMLTGVWPPKHGVRDNSFDGADYDSSPHFFQRLKEVKEDAVTASIVNWEPINQEILSGCDLSSRHSRDVEVAQAAVELLTNQDPDVLFIHFDEVDIAGHASGYGADSTGYLEAVSSTDGAIGIVLTGVQQRETYGSEDWLVLVSTDHAGVGRSHGEDLPELRTVFMIVSGPTVVGRRIKRAPEIVDVPPTVLNHLGLTPRSSWNWDGGPII